MLVLLCHLTVLIFTPTVWSQSETQTLCGISETWTSVTLPYSFCNNAWGDDGSGSSCLQVSDGGSSWQVTYKWTKNSEAVHGYPYVKLDDPQLPINISQLAAFNISGQWATRVQGSKADSAARQAQALAKANVKSNVAIDMFLDTTPASSRQLRPAYEVMIWLWKTSDIDPVGTAVMDSSNKNQMQYEINGARFYLYAGHNKHGQYVHSWLSGTSITNTSADYSPLIHFLWQFHLIPTDLFLGSIDFGTETFHATSPTVFSVDQYDMSISNVTQAKISGPIPPLTTPSPIPSPINNGAEKMKAVDSRWSWWWWLHLSALVLLCV